MNKIIKNILGFVLFFVLLLIIDLICIFTINRPIFALKNDIGDSVNLVYKGLFYDTYICHEYSTPQIKFKGTKFTCSYINIVPNKQSQYISTEIENVSINIYNVSLTGATLTIKDVNDNPYTYGEWYRIEKEVNGKWYEVKTVIDDYGFCEIGYLPDENNEVTFVLDWKWLYGELSLGSYRILKEVSDKYISVSFNIDNDSIYKLEIIRPEVYNLNRFNVYLEKDNKTIYLSPDIEEIFYYTDSDVKITLEDYIINSYQTLDDSIKNVTNLLKLYGELNDGGTEIYKSKEYDITLIKCNTIYGNKNIYIGDYSMDYDGSVACKL